MRKITFAKTVCNLLNESGTYHEQMLHKAYKPSKDRVTNFNELALSPQQDTLKTTAIYTALTIYTFYKNTFSMLANTMVKLYLE